MIIHSQLLPFFPGQGLYIPTLLPFAMRCHPARVSLCLPSPLLPIYLSSLTMQLAWVRWKVCRDDLLKSLNQIASFFSALWFFFLPRESQTGSWNEKTCEEESQESQPVAHFNPHITTRWEIHVCYCKLWRYWGGLLLQQSWLIQIAAGQMVVVWTKVLAVSLYTWIRISVV